MDVDITQLLELLPYGVLDDRGDLVSLLDRLVATELTVKIYRHLPLGPNYLDAMAPHYLRVPGDYPPDPLLHLRKTLRRTVTQLGLPRLYVGINLLYAKLGLNSLFEFGGEVVGILDAEGRVHL